MHYKLAVIISFFLFFNGEKDAYSQLIINELMQSNIDCIMDDINEFPDSWVELYNVGDEAENLSNYSLGLKEDINKAYRLPDKYIQPGCYQIIYCDKEEIEFHASFRLESGKGGNIYLFNGNDIVDKLETLPKQPAPNIAYGRLNDGANEWGYQCKPTPGAKNYGIISNDILENPIFSEPGKLFEKEFYLELKVPTQSPPGTIIRYTLNGEEPDEESQIYSEAIKISSTTIVRAKLVCDGWLSPRSVTHSYINHGRDVTLPIVSIVTNHDYFYDEKIGIYTQGAYIEDTPNYNYDWRRPINLEYFESNGTNSSINQLCETRIKGGATRYKDLKSLAVYANKRFGEKRFNHEFFPDQSAGISEFKSFELRNAGNDFDNMYMRDAIIQQSIGMNVDLDWQPSQPIILYINGVWKGVLNLRPRSNEDYIYSYYNGLEDIDMIENWDELKQGDWDNFDDFKQFYSEAGHTIDEFSQRMDVEEFCNYMIMNIFFDNKDFPGNNIVQWRPASSGGKWRWIAKDTDFGIGLYASPYNYPTLKWITTPGFDKENNINENANNEYATLLFRRLLDIREFRDLFIERVAIYMGDFLSADKIIDKVTNRYNELIFEYQFHHNVYNPSWQVYEDEIKYGCDWIKNRIPFFYNHIAEFFHLGNPVDLKITKVNEFDSSNTANYTDTNNYDGNLEVNNIAFSNGMFDGKYFAGRKLIIRFLPDIINNQYVIGWNVTVSYDSEMEPITHIYNTETLEIEMPNASKVIISPIFADSPLSSSNLYMENQPNRIYDSCGRLINVSNKLGLQKGVYIIRNGNRVTKILK